MKIPWKRLGSKLVEWTLAVIRATAPDKGQREPREPTSDEAFDQWKDGAK